VGKLAQDATQVEGAAAERAHAAATLELQVS
jgi:hypothetical protein